MRISIITVCYNADRDLSKTIESVLEQEHDDIEYIIKDGKSTDKTLQIVESIRKKLEERLSRFSFVSEKDKGLYDAMNIAADMATGEYVIFLNAGDTFYNNQVIHNVVKRISTEADIIYGDVMKRDCDRKWKQKASQEIHRIKRGMIFNHQTAFIRTTVMQKYRYNTRYRICADYDFFLRCYLDGLKFLYIEETISCFLVGGISYQRSFDLVEEAYRIQIENHVLKESYGQLLIIKTRVRKYIRKLIPNSIIIIIRNMKKCLMENKSRDNG